MSNPIESSVAVELIRTVGKWQVPALGAGTWALGGRWDFGGTPAGWGDVDDEVSITAIRAAYEGGVRLFDTADVYGCGHAERIVGKAVAPVRDEVVIATKVGLVFDEATRTGEGIDISPAYLRRACEASLRRLGTDDIDLYQLHPGEVTAEQAPAVVEVFDQLLAEGKIRSYGTANEAVDVIDVFAAGAGCVAVQQQLDPTAWAVFTPVRRNDPSRAVSAGRIAGCAAKRTQAAVASYRFTGREFVCPRQWMRNRPPGSRRASWDSAASSRVRVSPSRSMRLELPYP